MEHFIPKQLGPKEICGLLNLSYRQLDYWVLIGVVRPILEPHGKKVFKRFTDDDFYFLREVKALTDEGFLVSKAAQKVRESWSRQIRQNGEEESTK